jgi:amino acid transporter
LLKSSFGFRVLKNTEAIIENLEFSEFAGWGKTFDLEDLNGSAPIHRLDQEKRHFLGEWSSTALCGNDITSSCLYVSSISLAYAGIMAPVVLALVGFTLFLFRKIYSEVGSALPLNGGTYTLLLNTTSKKWAAAAACLTVLSYIATGVISANEAIHYLKVLFVDLPGGIAVICLLAVFAILVIIGVGESASVALGIFILHIATLVLLIAAGFFHFGFHHEVFFANMRTGWPTLDIGSSLFFGFSVALLGISGFESSANFIEEQKPGVFPKTLRNMWFAVTVLNPLIAFIALAIVPLDQMPQLGDGFLAHLGEMTLGSVFAKWIAIDAFLVLSGAVLTSYIGVLGLMRRMSLDRCLPQFFLRENTWRKTNHWIVLAFLAICISIFIMTDGRTSELAGVYTISFLAVMAFFAIGNILLKIRRGRLPRTEKASWLTVFSALTLVLIGICGNLILNPKSSGVFLIYYTLTLSTVMFLLLRTSLLRFLLHAMYSSFSSLPKMGLQIPKLVMKLIDDIGALPVLYFSRGDDLASLNDAAHYVLTNEQTKSLVVCHVYKNKDDIPKSLTEQVKIIDQIYPRLKIDLVLAKGEFGPGIIENIAHRLSITKNRMFIGSPGGRLPHRIEDLGGVRVILGGDGLH